MRMIHCERCGTVAAPDAAACGQCGAGLTPARPRNWAPPPNATPYAASEWAHTPASPAVFDKPAVITPPPPSSSLARLLSIVILVIVAVAIVAKLFFVGLLFRSESPRDLRLPPSVTATLRC